jgi:hypothetical protein
MKNRASWVLMTSCPDVHTVHLFLSRLRADEAKRNDILWRIFIQVDWPLRAVSIEGRKPEILPWLARFAGTLEEICPTDSDLPFGWDDMPVFPRVSELDIHFWRCYYRIPTVRAFPAVVHLQAYSVLSTNEDIDMMLNDIAKRQDAAGTVHAQPCEGWQRLDCVEGDVLTVHALMVPSRTSVRRLWLDVDVEVSWGVRCLCDTLGALRPAVLELTLTSGDGTDASWLWSARTLNAMASVQCLVFETEPIKRVISSGVDEVLELYEFTVC